MAQPASFIEALSGPRVGVIAEIKRRSPSAGAINEALDPAGLAADYQAGGAAAISVLTEGPHFGGSLADLRLVSGAVAIPALRKDFILDPVQLLEARVAGASAVLLIVRALEARELADLLATARSLGLDALVEVHNAAEVDVALEAGAEIVGVNARDLDDFAIDIDGSLELIASLPAGIVAVAESGMKSRADVERAARAGADAVLIGGALAGSENPRGLVADFAAVPRRGR